MWRIGVAPHGKAKVKVGEHHGDTKVQIIKLSLRHNPNQFRPV